MVDQTAEATLSNYQLRLPAYEGPLDVLLRLIERSQLAIEDVSLVSVTDQFLAFVAGMEEAPPAVIADFAAVGARLTVLKSRSLLPRPVVEAEEFEQSDLTHQLREYKQIRDLAKLLATIHAEGHHSYGSTTGAIARPTAARTVRLQPHESVSLVRALRRRISILVRPQQLIVRRKVVSLRDLVERLAGYLSPNTVIPFSQFTADLRTRTEVATAFLAVLVLVRRGQVNANQGELFADISLETGGSESAVETTDDNEFFD